MQKGFSYKSKLTTIPGTSFDEVYDSAFYFYKKLKSKTRRKPYVRSVYFKKDKVFLELFWNHLFEKLNWRDRLRRLKFFPCAIDLIKNSRQKPIIKENPNNKSEILYRFKGISKDNEEFFVQIKQGKNSNKKWFISVFPDKK